MRWQSVAFHVRVLSLLGSAAGRLIREDPAGFAGKVSERVRQSSQPVLRRVSERVAPGHSEKSTARKLIDAGQITEGIELVKQNENATRSDRYRARWAEQRLKQLRAVPSETPQVHTDSSGPHKVLHVLTNSLPYTQSGYTLRSHKVLTSTANAGVVVEAITRLAYPVLVGKWPAGPAQIVDGTVYHRMLPWRYPGDLQEREDLAVNSIVEHARTMGATILHTTTDFHNAAVTSRAAAELRIPWVYEIRGELESTWASKRPVDERPEQSEFYALAQAQETAYASSAAAVITLSEIAKKQFVERGIDPGRITVVPNAIDESGIGRDFDPAELRAELGLPVGPLIGAVTSVVPYEGLDVLIKSLPLVDESVRILIVGEGSARPVLELLARDLGLTDRVIFVGRQPEETIWRWYGSLDAFVMPRKDLTVTRNVTPIKALTAQALSVPVIASDLPALREVTGGMATYVTPEDPRALAHAISSVLQRQRPKYSPAEIGWIRGRTWQANAQRYVQLYDGLMGETGS